MLGRKSLIVAGVALGTICACDKSHVYETTAEVMRISVSRRDDRGNPLNTDFEVRYPECPGSQVEVVRGGAAFSECVQKFKAGERLHVKIDHHVGKDGYYDYDVIDVQGCAHLADPDDEASYKMVRQCNDWVVSGTRVGFKCNYAAKAELNTKCPWFKKR